MKRDEKYLFDADTRQRPNPFTPSSQRFVDEVVARNQLVDRAIPFHVSYLDDVCRCIMPHDLIVLGADTGAGKTAIALQIASENAAGGQRVHYIALEGEPCEMERRLKYQRLVRLAYENRVEGRRDLNYAEWYLGRCGSIVGRFESQAIEWLKVRYATLFTFYRERDFTLADIGKLFKAITGETDLVVLDHLHYVDIDPSENENRAVKAIVKGISDLALVMGVPVIVVAHLRKKESRRQLLPAVGSFHGGSDITKIATRAIVLAPAFDRPDLINLEGKAVPGIAMTYMAVLKDRPLGASNTVALIGFDLARKQYLSKYQVGRMDVMGEQWSPIDFGKKPVWAKNAIPTVEAA